MALSPLKSGAVPVHLEGCLFRVRTNNLFNWKISTLSTFPPLNIMKGTLQSFFFIQLYCGCASIVCMTSSALRRIKRWGLKQCHYHLHSFYGYNFEFEFCAIHISDRNKYSRSYEVCGEQFQFLNARTKKGWRSQRGENVVAPFSLSRWFERKQSIQNYSGEMICKQKRLHTSSFHYQPKITNSMILLVAMSEDWSQQRIA